MIRVLLVDDQDIFRQGLADLLDLEDDLAIIGQARNGYEAIEQASQLQPDVVLMDIRMPVCDGVMATREIHQRYPWIRILVLTTFDEDEYICQSLQAGALGYLLKSTPTSQVSTAIRTLHQGHSQLGPTIALKVFSQINPIPVTKSSDSVRYQLSDREKEILILLGKGLKNREIAQQLYLSEGTVKNYISRILSEMGMRDRTQAALWVQKNL